MRDEQLGWRDERISARHRTWGCDCPAADIDFLVLEYDGGVASGLVEYKHDNGHVNLESASNRALKNFADRANIPFFVARYDPAGWTFRVYPGNDQAWDLVDDCHLYMPEEEWVRLVYRMRGRSVPPHVIARMRALG